MITNITAMRITIIRMPPTAHGWWGTETWALTG
jgi:hypothetical protein